MTRDRPRIAFFRPADRRTERARTIVRSLGAEPVADPLLAIAPTAALPRTDATFVIITSRTGADLLAEGGWEPGSATVCAIGEATAAALTDRGIEVAVVPDEFSSSGLVERLADTAEGAKVEVARSDHGSPVLIDGLRAAGAYVHETILYELTMPSEAGGVVPEIVAGEIDAVLFTSSLTVDHFLAAARERGLEEEVRAELTGIVVGAIGAPTSATATERGLEVDVVANRASFEELVRAVVGELKR